MLYEVITVKYTVSNSCSTSDTNFVFTAYGKPIVTFAPIADACGKLVYDPATERNVTFNDNGNPITAYKWRISPSTGVSFISGNENSKFPVINFENDGAYTLTLEATNKCGTTTVITSYSIHYTKLYEWVQPKTEVGW